MKASELFLRLVLWISLIISICFLIYVYVVGLGSHQWEGVAAELLLVIVLAAEGLFAISHIAESKAARQAEALRDFMHTFASAEALESREKLFTKIPWGHDFCHTPDKEIQWTCQITGPDVKYTMAGNDNVVVEITMASETWRRIQELSDQYHFAGLSCQRGYLKTEDILEWMGPQALRWWRRLGGIIRHERKRRQNPGLFKGFEDLAEKVEDSTSR
jgi:hypothetical protein